MKHLEARALSFSVGVADLVTEVDLSVAEEEFVAVVGPNGAGKSTLVRLLAGDLKPTGGVIELGGRVLADLPVDRLALARAFLPQTVSPDVPFAVGDVVAMGRYPHRLDPANSPELDEQAVRDATGWADVGELTSRVFATLSGGEQTRVSLARILAQDAPLLLLDEPTAALDLRHQESMMEVLGEQARGGKAVLAVLHNLNLAAAYADRIIVMNGSRIVAEGRPAEVLRGDLLSAVYGIPLHVVDHPFRDCPLVLSADRNNESPAGAGPSRFDQS